MVKLIAALGNPGRRYEKTRHNAGWLYLEEWAHRYKATWKVDRKFNAQVAEVVSEGQKLILLKPLSFMNLSGLSIGAAMRFYKFLPEELLVIHDEVAFDSGRLKLSFEGSGGGHNGIANIIQELGNQGFWRLRLGVGPKPPEISLSDFVLGRLIESELKWLKNKDNVSNLTLIVDNGLQKAQTHMNQNIT